MPMGRRKKRRRGRRTWRMRTPRRRGPASRCRSSRSTGTRAPEFEFEFLNLGMCEQLLLEATRGLLRRAQAVVARCSHVCCGTDTIFLLKPSKQKLQNMWQVGSHQADAYVLPGADAAGGHHGRQGLPHLLHQRLPRALHVLHLRGEHEYMNLVGPYSGALDRPLIHDMAWSAYICSSFFSCNSTIISRRLLF